MNKKRLRQSFKDAFRGFGFVYKNEQNFRIQIVIAFTVLALAFVLGLQNHEFIILLLLIILVLLLELLNTAGEKILDLLKPRLHIHVQSVKDIMASAVLFSSLGAAIVGLMIFYPYLIELIR